MNDLGVPSEIIERFYDDLEENILMASTKGYNSAAADEDTLTGEFGSAIRFSGKNKASVNGKIVPWEWDFDYTKIRGRGAGAPEKHIGADGIIVASVTIGDRKISKTVLFQ
jgi:hypothetical protein